MLYNPSLYLTASLLYATQARDALAHRHPCAVYWSLAAVHIALAARKALAW